MAEIKNTATGEMGHQVTGKVAILYGTVKAISPDGTVRILKLNSPVYSDDRIITGDDGSVSIVFNTFPSTQLDLGRVSEVTIDEDVYGAVTPEVTAEASAEQKAIQDALLAGDQPIEVDPTAAGAEASSGGGHPTFVVSTDWSIVTPESGAETTGVTWGTQGTQLYSPMEQENSTPAITVDPGNGPDGGDGGTTPGPYDGGTGGSGVIGGVTYINDVVYEAGLPDGSDAGKTTIATGTFTVSDPDGLNGITSVTINGTEIPINELVGTEIDGNYGTLTITGYNSSTGEGTYSYELTSATTDGPGTETDAFTLTTTDQDGATSDPAVINIEIADDLPNAVDDFDSIDEDSTTPITGNVFSNDVHPNGQPGADTPATFDTWTGNTTAQYGTFVPGADGTYTYTLDNNNPAVQGLGDGQTLTETFTYQIHDADGDIDTATLTIVINGADEQPIVGITSGTDLGGGSAVEGNPITFTVYLDKAVDVDTTVTVKVVGVAGDTATPGADYTPISTLTVTIPNGSTSATFDVSTLVDQLLEGSETFTAEIVSASNANGAVEIGTGSAIGTILDNYIPPVISIGTGAEGGSAVEGNPVTFTVSLDKASDADTTVTVKVVGVAGDTATPGADYTTISTYDVVILKGQTSATFTVDTLTDNIKEGSEYFTAEIVDASNPIGTINIGTASAVGTILDDYNNTQPTTAVSYAYVDDDGLAGDNPASTLGDYAVPNTDGDASEATFSGTLNFTTGNLPATINAFSEMDGKTGNVGQETVTYSWNDTTDTLTATVSAGARVGTFLFTVQMTDTTTGAYKVTLLDNVLHETLNGLSGDNTENDASATLNYTVTDNDGETATGTLSIVFDDDMPTATAKEHTVTVQSPESTGVIGNLAAGWTTPLDTHVLTNSSLTYSDDADSYYEKISWGANGNYSSYEFHDATISNVHIDESFNLGTFTHNNFPIQSGTAISTASLIVTFNLTVGGETIHVEHTVQFNHNETPNDGADPRDIVTIVNGTNQVDVTVGDYTYTLNIGFADSSFNPVTQVYTVENNSNTFNLVGKLTASLDNEPTATGVIGAADANFGADGAASPKIVAITHDGITYDTGDLVGNKLTITTHEGGKFEINFSTGEYKYTAPSGESYVDRSEVFTYTVEDADGDMASSTITMNVPGEDVPTVNENLLVQLDDDALAGGNTGGVGDATPDTAHTSGTLAHDFGGDGAGSIAYLTSGAPSGFTYELSGGNLLVKQGTTTVMTLTVNSTTGAYTITQNAAIDHTALQAENDQEFTINYRVTDSNGDSAEGTLLINVDDDTPIAGAQNVFVEADTSTVGTNLLIVLDVSGSMDYASGVTGYTRLGLAKDALGKLIDEYSGHGDVMVRLVTFSDSAAKVGSVWMTVAEAKAAINSLSANGSTNYDAPLTTAIDAFDDAGALVGAQNISYFLSDGDPNRPTGSVGINSSEQNTWETFLKHNDITSFALGMGQIIQPSALQPIAYDGLNEVQIDSVVVTDLSQLSSVLLGTVIIPSSIEGELITGAVDTSFGADGNNTYKIVSVEYNGTTHGTGELVGNQLTIDTTVGGKLIADFTTGHYSYTAPDGLTDSAQETFTYTIQDGDGDTASNALKIQVLPEDSTQDYSASASGVTTTATVDEPNIIGSDHNDTLTGDSNANFLFGGEGDDSISGGDGNDTLSGGTGNNSLAGGAGADTFVITNGAHDTIFEYSKADLDKVDISHVLNEDAGDYLNVVKGDDGVHVKLEVLNSSGVEKASVTFANIDYSSLDSSDSAHLLDSLLAKVDVDHDG